MAYNNNTYYISDSPGIDLSNDYYSSDHYKLASESMYTGWMRYPNYSNGNIIKLARGGVSYLGSMIPETIEINNQRSNGAYIEPNKSSPYLQSFITSYMMWPNYIFNYDTSTKQGQYISANRTLLINNHNLRRKINIHVYTDEDYYSINKPSEKGLMIEGIKVKLYNEIISTSDGYDSKAGTPPDKTLYRNVWVSGPYTMNDGNIKYFYLYENEAKKYNSTWANTYSFSYMETTSINTDIYNDDNLIFSKEYSLAVNNDNRYGFRQRSNYYYVLASKYDTNTVHPGRAVGTGWFYDAYLYNSSLYSNLQYLTQPPYSNSPNPADPETIYYLSDPFYDWVYCRTDFTCNINLYGAYPYVTNYHNGTYISRKSVRLICEIEIDLLNCRTSAGNDYHDSQYQDGAIYDTYYYIEGWCQCKSNNASNISIIDPYVNNIKSSDSGNSDAIFDVDEFKIFYANYDDGPYYSKPTGHIYYWLHGNNERRRKKYIRFYVPWYWVETDINVAVRCCN